VVETGSMTQAAKRLRQPVSRVSRAVARLESELNQHLVLRTTRSFQITEAGRRLFRDVQPLVARIADVQRSFHEESEELTGLVRITAPEDMGASTIAPLLVEFGALHPGLRFDLNLTDEFVDLVRTETDIGLRAGRLRDSTLKAKRLGTSVFIWVASPRYIDRYGAPKRPQDLERLRSIHLVLGPSDKRIEWTLINGSRREKLKINSLWSVNHTGAAMALAKAGVGATLCPATLAAPALAAGELVHILPGWTSEPAPVHLVFPPQRITSRKVREVARFLEERLKPLFEV
jgi:LysR family transcriptional regulator for bpeEF and oprC